MLDKDFKTRDLQLFEKIFELKRKKLTYVEIAKELNLSKDNIYRCVKRHKEEFLYGEKVFSEYVFAKKDGLIELIIEMYNNQISSEEIGKKFGYSQKTIIKWLQKNGVKIRPNGTTSRTEQNIFKKIDSEEKAYFLGILLADGSMTSTERSISLTLTVGDQYLLEQINNQIFDGTGHILLAHKEDEKPRSVLQIHGKELCSDLKKYGIVPRKTYLPMKLSNKIPKEFYHHYLRGLYDGDGVCSNSTSHGKRKVRIGFCSYTREFVEEYRNYFCNLLGMKQNKLFNTGNCWQCSWSSEKNLTDFYNYIYKDSTICLSRKEHKLRKFLQSINANIEVNK